MQTRNSTGPFFLYSTEWLINQRLHNLMNNDLFLHHRNCYFELENWSEFMQKTMRCEKWTFALLIWRYELLIFLWLSKWRLQHQLSAKLFSVNIILNKIYKNYTLNHEEFPIFKENGLFQVTNRTKNSVHLGGFSNLC